MIEKYIKTLESVGMSLHLGGSASLAIAETIATLTLIAVCVLLFYLVRFILKKTVYGLIQRSTNKYDDLIVKNKFITRLCLLVPTLLFGALLPCTLPDYAATAAVLLKLNNILEILVFTFILTSIVNTMEDFYNTFDMAKLKPITGLMQVIKIVLFVITAIVIIAYLMGTKISNVLISLGTASAVLMLVFQDIIKGFVGGIQLTMNDMIRIGDWIEMGRADGVVTEVGLITVKVQNWDNSITTLPTYNMVSSPFTNWRGMEESGGRRIMRNVLIDIQTVRFCTPEMLERYKQYDLIRDYVTQREKDILEFNEKQHFETDAVINGRQQTNLGIFRAYIRAYLERNPQLNHELTTMVRQRQPTELGIPLQIYVFTKTKSLVPYEDVQSDLFDHILAAAPLFDLRVFQKKT